MPAKCRPSFGSWLLLLILRGKRTRHITQGVHGAAVGFLVLMLWSTSGYDLDLPAAGVKEGRESNRRSPSTSRDNSRQSQITGSPFIIHPPFCPSRFCCSLVAQKFQSIASIQLEVCGTIIFGHGCWVESERKYTGRVHL